MRRERRETRKSFIEELTLELSLEIERIPPGEWTAKGRQVHGNLVKQQGALRVSLVSACLECGMQGTTS